MPFFRSKQINNTAKPCTAEKSCTETDTFNSCTLSIQYFLYVTTLRWKLQSRQLWNLDQEMKDTREYATKHYRKQTGTKTNKQTPHIQKSLIWIKNRQNKKANQTNVMGILPIDMLWVSYLRHGNFSYFATDYNHYNNEINDKNIHNKSTRYAQTIHLCHTYSASLKLSSLHD